MMSYGLCVLLLIAIPGHIFAYKSGAPDSVCDTMLPDHGHDPKPLPSPYSIKPSKTSIKAGESITVELSGSQNNKFRGYFIQARVGKTPIGKFEKGPEINLVNCGSGVATAATHTDNNDKEKITLTWTAPAGLTESVRFRCAVHRTKFSVTFVKTGDTYWVGQESKPITIQ